MLGTRAVGGGGTEVHLNLASDRRLLRVLHGGHTEGEDFVGDISRSEVRAAYDETTTTGASVRVAFEVEGQGEYHLTVLTNSVRVQEENGSVTYSYVRVENPEDGFEHEVEVTCRKGADTCLIFLTHETRRKLAGLLPGHFMERDEHRRHLQDQELEYFTDAVDVQRSYEEWKNEGLPFILLSTTDLGDWTIENIEVFRDDEDFLNFRGIHSDAEDPAAFEVICDRKESNTSCKVYTEFSHITRRLSNCFSLESTVNVYGKGDIQIRDLKVGDAVMTAGGKFETVYANAHFHANKRTSYYQIHTEHSAAQKVGPIEISGSHMIYVNSSLLPVVASKVSVGDYLQTINGSTKVTRIEEVIRHGFSNPMTMGGSIVVNGIEASAFALPGLDEMIRIAGIPIVHYQAFYETFQIVNKVYCMNPIASTMGWCQIPEDSADEFILNPLGDAVHQFLVHNKLSTLCLQLGAAAMAMIVGRFAIRKAGPKVLWAVAATPPASQNLAAFCVVA